MQQSICCWFVENLTGRNIDQCTVEQAIEVTKIHFGKTFKGNYSKDETHFHLTGKPRGILRQLLNKCDMLFAIGIEWGHLFSKRLAGPFPYNKKNPKKTPKMRFALLIIDELPKMN